MTFILASIAGDRRGLKTDTFIVINLHHMINDFESYESVKVVFCMR